MLVNFRTVSVWLLMTGFVCYASAADDGATPRLRVTKAAGISRLRPYVPGSWGLVDVEVTNSTSRDAKILVSSYLRGNSYRQFARLFWIPAGARRTSWQLLYLPKTFGKQAKSIDIESVAYDRTDSNSDKRLLRDGSNRIIHSHSLPFANEFAYTAVIADRQIPQNSDADFALETVVACAFRRYATRRTILLAGDLPTTEAALESFRGLVLCSDRISADAAALRAVRRWVQSGGSLWIMIDRVQQATVEKLLGDVSPFQEIDRVELTAAQVHSKNAERWGRDSQPRQFEKPVDLVRVLAGDSEVTHTVAGWPAAFRRKLGRGKILFTTLGMRAWLRRSNSNDERETAVGLRLLPREPLEKLTSEWFAVAEPSPIRIDAFEDYLARQIGYEVVDRRTVLLVLVIFCAGLLVTFVWFRRVQRMELMLWIGPVLALCAAVALTAMGFRSRRSVPEMVAIVQIVEVAENSETANVTGLMAVYRQDESRSTIGVRRGGLLQLGFAERPATTRPMLWTDLDRWQWTDSNLSAGVHQTEFSYAANIKTPLSVIGQFGPMGLHGTLRTGPFPEPADAVFTTATGLACGVQLESDGRFVSGPTQAFPPGEFIGGTFLSDEQRRRQDVYRKLWKTKNNVPLAGRPTLFVWTKPIDMGFQVNDEQKRVGSALLSIPLRLERTAPGTQVRIPATFLPFKRVLDPDGRLLSASYSNRRREWIERRAASRTWLRFQLPQQVRPIVLDQATVRVHFDGRSRKLDIAAFVNGKTEIIASYEKPSGEVHLSINRPEALKLDARGGLLLGIFVAEGEKNTPRKSITAHSGPIWKMKYVRIDVAGKTAEQTP